MAGLAGRMSTVVKAKISKMLDKAEDPSETLEYSYQKQIELLQKRFATVGVDRRTVMKMVGAAAGAAAGADFGLLSSASPSSSASTRCCRR